MVHSQLHKRGVCIKSMICLLLHTYTLLRCKCFKEMGENKLNIKHISLKQGHQNVDYNTIIFCISIDDTIGLSC